MRRLREPAAALLTLAVVLGSAGCGEPLQCSEESPTCADVPLLSGAQSGYYPVRFDVGLHGLRAAAIERVDVGGLAAYDLHVTADGLLSATVQGHPEAGLKEVRVWTAEGEHALGPIFRYQAPVDPRFDRLVALGASLTQGVQRGVPLQRGILMSPPAQLARQLGGFFPLPVLVEPLFPQVGPADIGPPPLCSIPNITDFVARQAAAVIPRLEDDARGDVSYRAARVDPDLRVANVAVGGSTVADVLDGPGADDLGGNFVSAIMYAPDTEFLQPVAAGQLAQVRAMAPTLIVSTDLFANDVVSGLQRGDAIDIANSTSEAVLLAHIRRGVGELADTGAEVFLGTLPRPSLLPLAQEKRWLMQQAGYDEPAIEAQIRAIDRLAVAANAALADAAERYANVHVVELARAVSDIQQSGLEVGAYRLGAQKFGGLLGLDGIHFSDTGYAFVANRFIAAINAALGTRIAPIRLESVAARDPDLPIALRRAGLDIDRCH